MTVLQAFSASTVHTVGDSSVFILDAPCFQDLQRYLDVATNLPSTEAKFNEQFNKGNLEVYFKDDQELYKALQGKLTEICEHCGTFQDALIPAMLSLARGMALFATDCNKRYAKIRGLLATSTAGEARLANHGVNNAFKNAHDELKELVRRANGRGFECEALIVKLANFRRITVEDENELSLIHSRFVKVIPDGGSASNVIDTMFKESFAECEKISDVARTKKKWSDDGQYGMSAALLNFLFPRMGYTPFRTFDEIEWDVNNHTKIFQAALAKHDLLGKNIKNGLVQVKALILALTTIYQTLDKSMECVQGMINVFIDMGACFTAISEQLNSIGTTTTEPNMEDHRRNALKEFEDPPKVWTDIAKVAADFSRNGNIFEDQRRSKKAWT